MRERINGSLMSPVDDKLETKKPGRLFVSMDLNDQVLLFLNTIAVVVVVVVFAFSTI